MPGAIAIVLVVAGFIAMRTFGGGDGTGEMQTAVAKRGDLELTISATGAIKPHDTVDVGAQVSGQLKIVHIEVGDDVEKGQLLAEIDPTLLQARVASSRASLDKLKAQLAQQEAEAVLARQQHERNARLYKSDAISQDTVQSSEAALKIADARIDALKAEIRQAESSLGEHEANLNYTKIYAPISGTVISETAVEGQTLNANQTTPTVMRIAELQTMTVWAEVSEADVMRLEIGMPVYFKTLGSGQRTWESKLRQVLPEPEIVNDVVLFKALVDVENTDRQLLPEMTAQIFFVEGRADDTVLVPIAALLSPEGKGKPDPKRRLRTPQAPSLTSNAEAAEQLQTQNNRGNRTDDKPGTEMRVLVATGNSFESRTVRVGLKGRSQAEILDGLNPGEVVALPGLVRNTSSGNDGGRRRFGARL